MVGDWVDQDEDATIESSVNWTKNGKFLTRSFRVTPKNGGQEIPMFLEALPGTPIKNDPLAFMNIVPEGKTTDAFWP